MNLEDNQSVALCRQRGVETYGDVLRPVDIHVKARLTHDVFSRLRELSVRVEHAELVNDGGLHQRLLRLDLLWRVQLCNNR
jgi:hypothetical protein